MGIALMNMSACALHCKGGSRPTAYLPAFRPPGPISRQTDRQCNTTAPQRRELREASRARGLRRPPPRVRARVLFGVQSTWLPAFCAPRGRSPPCATAAAACESLTSAVGVGVVPEGTPSWGARWGLAFSCAISDFACVGEADMGVIGGRVDAERALQMCKVRMRRACPYPRAACRTDEMGRPVRGKWPIGWRSGGERG
ncbi:hypothetical protein P171DRAFT_116730 [Karstenula rhodostoma CBS 690.94]|uniref:Uncharacterized protein n=1 Tax=Karstenula rhodostoma CBS 690.94 TaxID=1392251 RepID=A0A9P4P7V1_9PLEO|nr:hypothetical protein P171DRAFT_116730 [Karstenula rhodostoma CBS 690.94]